MKESKLVTFLTILIAIIATMCLFLMMFLIFQTPKDFQKDNTTPAPQKTTVVTAIGSGVDAVEESPGVMVNDALGEDVIKATSDAVKTTTSVVKDVVETVTKTEEPADEYVGIDEDVAKARAKANGRTVYSVYVFDKEAYGGASDRPKAGMVLAATHYDGMVKGEKFTFLYVATSVAYANAATVPDLSGKSWQDARAILERRGLTVRFDYEQESASKYGTVVFQAPGSGALMPQGCSVVLILAD